MKLSEVKTAAQVVEERRQADPEFRREWDREAFARAVAAEVVKYRLSANLPSGSWPS